MSAFVHAQGYKNCPHKGGGVKKWQNSVHVVVECPLSTFSDCTSNYLLILCEKDLCVYLRKYCLEQYYLPT